MTDLSSLHQLGEREALEDLAHLVGDADPDLLQDAMPFAVVVLAHERDERAVDGGHDLGQRDLLRRPGEDVSTTDATLGLHEPGALHGEEDLLQIWLREARTLGDLLHRRGPILAV